MLRAVVIKLEYASEIALLKMQVEGCVPWNAAPQTSSPALLGQGNREPKASVGVGQHTWGEKRRVTEHSSACCHP